MANHRSGIEIHSARNRFTKSAAVCVVKPVFPLIRNKEQ